MNRLSGSNIAVDVHANNFIYPLLILGLILSPVALIAYSLRPRGFFKSLRVITEFLHIFFETSSDDVF